MTLDKIIVIVGGFLGIIFTYWFFLMKKDKGVEVSDHVNVIIDGGYSPEVISVPQGKTTIINFIRKDPTSCLDEVVISDFKIRKYLPLNQKVSVEIKPDNTGEYIYSCGMNMYHGKIIVK